MKEIIVKNDKKIEDMIYEIRGKQVMLDSDLAVLYECANGTKTINLAVKWHINRFPERFMFQLTERESENIRFQVETKKNTLETRGGKYNIPMLFNSAYNRNNVNLNEIQEWMKNAFEKDYNDLSDITKEQFKERYELIKNVVLHD